ncbi:1-deoxy-D-xylulose-5-phosphate synthase [Candidatus Venteria ishoeyi]|uniref:1-deoxy-D-xylulose-5-phosphate synthase n=1 Tax=Candidatus Venteria ishoeyi TaxID=1899563 RepID=UPI0025A4F1E7|nr:1-deoxy-D-xylulose-5-phosphate synthase [Candidatus Venteria ishoeyi]MDM8548250.1 1-deoxy-D-xylulose-5-phosphate synthase [Candidatus Venteria ishoeyi]
MSINTSTTPLLDQIHFPQDLRRLPEADLPQLAMELRNFLIACLSESGGHFSSNLGVIELTVALHYVFNTPEDRLIWDVGHQAYPHKILTGRRDAIKTIRQNEGLAGFPKRSESPYDSFGVGHSSTSISAALGMAIAARQVGSHRKSIAIIGDGAMTAGMAFEALNHAGDLGANMLVILNDNNMSISPNVGALKNHLAEILSGGFYTGVREGGKKLLSHAPLPLMKLAQRTEEYMKGMLVAGTLFEEFGFNYIGPVDGHDLPALLSVLKNIHELEGPQFLHVITRKGKGYPPAEADPCSYHGVSAFDQHTGEMSVKTSTAPTYAQVFGDWLCDMAARDQRLIGITPAMSEGSGMVRFSRQFPERYFDVGIAEQHSVTLAAGMACEGLKPVVAIYSTFLQRAYDQLIHDVVLQDLPVLFAIDRAGLVGADGPTHAGSFDLSYLRCIPNIVIMTPANEDECRKLLTTGFLHPGAAAVRYPRGSGAGVTIEPTLNPLPIGKADVCLPGDSDSKVVLLVFGSLLTVALDAAQQLNASVVNMRFVKPLDEDLLKTLANRYELLVTIEENAIMGGAGSAVNEYLHQQNLNTPVLNLGLPDYFQDHGSQASLLAEAGLDAPGICAAIERIIPDVD